MAHPLGGVVALPLLARLYIRQKTLGAIPAKCRPAFATKLEMAVELVRWAHEWLKLWAKAVWVVADGAYARAPVLKPLRELGVTVVSRLRRDAALCSVPAAPDPKRRGRRPVYGKQRLSLAKRAGQKGGWTTGTFMLYGKAVEKSNSVARTVEDAQLAYVRPVILPVVLRVEGKRAEKVFARIAPDVRDASEGDGMSEDRFGFNAFRCGTRRRCAIRIERFAAYGGLVWYAACG